LVKWPAYLGSPNRNYLKKKKTNPKITKCPCIRDVVGDAWSHHVCVEWELEQLVSIPELFIIN